jgi:hypothetical protein
MTIIRKFAENKLLKKQEILLEKGIRQFTVKGIYALRNINGGAGYKGFVYGNCN